MIRWAEAWPIAVDSVLAAIVAALHLSLAQTDIAAAALRDSGKEYRRASV